MPVPACPVHSTVLTHQDAPTPTSCIHAESHCTAEYRGSDLGAGQLFITEGNISWIREDNMGFRLNYKQLIAHAISKDPAVYPRPCVYMLYEPEVRTGDAALAAAQEGGQDEEESSNVEIRIAPQHENSVRKIYESISDGQLLHPDADDSDSEELIEGETEGYVGGGGGLAMSSQIRFDSDGQLIVNEQDEDQMDKELDENRRFEDMDED